MVMIWERKLVEQGAWVGNVGWGMRLVWWNIAIAEKF